MINRDVITRESALIKRASIERGERGFSMAFL